MCTRPFTIRVPCNPYEEHMLGYRSMKEVQVPCGKCPECLMERQKDISVRAYREAYNYGSCYFLTLTYAPDYVPFAQNLLDINKDTGEVLVARLPELCTNEYLDFARIAYRRFRGKGCFYYYKTLATFSGLDDCKHEYQMVLTPTLYVRDFRLVVKNFRVKFEREFNIKPDFKYICVGEYGSNDEHSHRPHYHVLLFGLNQFQVDYLASMWTFGTTYLEKVFFKNRDGSDGIAKVSSYVAKYASKGSFVPESVTRHLVLNNRICSSIGVGLSNLDNLIYFHRCYDMVGQYNIDDVHLSGNKLEVLCYQVLSRLYKSFSFNGKSINLPNSLKRKIFGYKVVDGKALWSDLYYKVMDFARVRASDLRDEQFKQFLSKRDYVPLAVAVDAFNDLQKGRLESREFSEKQSFARIYSKSKL